MKKFSILAFVTLCALVSGCGYDDSEIWNRIEDLEEQVEENSSDIATLTSLVNALSEGRRIIAVEQSDKGVKITFDDNTTVVINHGKDGEDGDSLFESVEILEDSVVIILTDGRKIVLPRTHELRVLTFEDEDAAFEPYTLDYCAMEVTTWSQLIARGDQQGYGQSPLLYGSTMKDATYWWWDQNNTDLYHTFPYNWGGYAYSGGGAAISSHTVTMDRLMEHVAAGGDIYAYQLSITAEGGHGGSENFAVFYNDSQVESEVKSEIAFADGRARVIDHMWVTLSAVTHYCLKNGNGFSDSYDEDDFLKIVATGVAEDGSQRRAELFMTEGSELVTDWTKWDLSELGEVVAVRFHMEEAQVDDYGYAAYYRSPLYFAVDDVAVRY